MLLATQTSVARPTRRTVPRLTCEVCVFETTLARYTASRADRRTPSHVFRLTPALVALLVALISAAMLPGVAHAATVKATGSKPLPAVIDYSSGFSASTPTTLKKAGVGVVIRYVGSSAWKCLTPGEAAALRSQGIDIASVYESTAGWMLGGRTAGVDAAKAARAAIVAAGGPSRPFVYFACDVDTSDYASVNASLAGAQSVLGANNVGIYGGYSVCANALKAGAAAKAWQTVAWSNGQVLPGAALLQLVPQTLGNLGVDYDSNVRYVSDVGQWGLGDRPIVAPSGMTSAGALLQPTSALLPAAPTIALAMQSAPTSATLRAVATTDGVNAWAVGDRGTILHTDSAGATWTVQSAPTTATLRAVSFTDASNGWAVGDGGTVLHTTSGGTIWESQLSSSTATLTAVSFADRQNGWATGTGGTMLHTTDGGFDWVAQTVPATGTITTVRFSSDATGVAVAQGGGFLFTGNGGRSWFQVSTPTTATLSAYGAVGPGVAWSVGTSGTVLATRNDGATWEKRSVPTSSALNGVAFSDASRGVAVGASGTALFTSDAGQTWAPQSVATTGALNGVALSGPKGWAVGENGAIFRLEVTTP